MKIGEIDLNKEVYVIAEIGNNHEGSPALAEELIGLAAEAGANAVKFQTIVPEELVSGADRARIAQLKKFQLSFEQFERLSVVAKQAGVHFLSTPFSLNSVDFLNPLVPAFKIASGDNNFYPLIEKICRTGKPIILSTGLENLAEVEASRNFILGAWRGLEISAELALLHCVVSYPTPPEEANLLAITAMKSLGTTVGYSDHTLGTAAAVLAVALGARIIEKHFTKDRSFSEFRDHQLSADPKELALLIRQVREAQVLLGSADKVPTPSELLALVKVRRSIVAGRDLPSGSRLTFNDLSWVRPGDGIPPGNEEQVIGKTLLRSLKRGEKIILADLAYK